MNIGRAVSVQLGDEPQRVVTMASPTGRVVNSAMAIQPQLSSPSPIHSPAANSANSARMRKSAISIWSMGRVRSARAEQRRGRRGGRSYSDREIRSDEGRVGEECASTCGYRGARAQKKKK